MNGRSMQIGIGRTDAHLGPKCVKYNTNVNATAKADIIIYSRRMYDRRNAVMTSSFFVNWYCITDLHSPPNDWLALLFAHHAACTPSSL